MTISKEDYFGSKIGQLTQARINQVILVGICIFLLLDVMDYFVIPEKFAKFMLYRLLVNLALLGLYGLNTLKINLNFQRMLTVIGLTLSAMAIELMIISSGGYRSPYYAGLNLVIIAGLGFIPINMFISSLTVILIYAVYLVPIFTFDKITDTRLLISHNAFMLATIVIALAWRKLSQKHLLNELGLQYELNKEKQKLENYSTFLEDIVSERTKELQKSEQWHRQLFESATDGIIVLDRNGIIVNANEKACSMHGFARDMLIGAHIKLLEVDGDRGIVAERMRQILDGDAMVFETVHHRKDGALIHLEISSKTVFIAEVPYIQSLYRDITEKKQIRDHMLQSQKMESIGLLAGGIAHDFNNILTAIIGHVDMIRQFGSLSEVTSKSLNVIEDVSQKASKMVSKLLGFSRKTNYEIVPVNLNSVVKDTVKLLEHSIDSNINFTVQLDEQLPSILGDFTQLEQVIMNFIINARDAMLNGGAIDIITSCQTITKGTDSVPPYVTPGEYVLLNVKDTGAGIPKRLLNKIFEPFFTTKGKDKGTGLGLAMVYGVIKDHKGHIAVQSKLGVGSTFSVYLPVYRQTAAVTGKTTSTT